jgi:hypothetical protein
MPTMDGVLHYGFPLVLETSGITDPDRRSFLFVEPEP